MAPLDRMRMRVVFPAGIEYGASLGKLRRALKSHLHIEIRKRHDGACLSGPSNAVAVVPLILPMEFSIAEWKRHGVNPEGQQS
jgi:hypothetical protein